ncbi:MAG: tetratricopeptide repeat protein [Treponema sp.]|jgi:hypothetical protein|nr:tetratricopeptide repeat protein [Treponema sp.]
MPSINELQKFKSSFENIGNQMANLMAKNIPFDDLELPHSEPTAPIAAASPEPAPSAAAESAESSSEDDIDFSAFLGTSPDDLPNPPSAVVPEEDMSSIEDLYAPEGLLSNLSEELDAIPPDFPEVAADSGKELDLDSLDNFDLPEEPLTPSNEDLANISDNLDSGILEDFDLPVEPTPAEESGSVDLDSLGDLSLSDESSNADLGGFDDLGLPDEPGPEDDSSNIDLGGFDDLGLPDEPGPEDESSNIDLGSFDDLGLPDEPGPEDESSNADLGGFDDLGLPDGPGPEDDNSDVDLGSFDDLGLPDEPAPADESSNIDLGGFDDLGLPDEPGPEDDSSNIDLGGFDDLGLPDEPAPADESSNIDLGGFDDLALPDEPGSADESSNIDLGGFDDLGLSDEPSSAEEGSDVDMGSFDDLGLSDESDTADEGENSDISGKETAGSNAIDDFSFPELDNVLKRADQKAKGGKAAKPAKKGKGRGKTKKPVIESPDDVEEIQLSDDEFEGLQESLSRYPLNLRVACEEIIVEQAVDPKQMSELIEHLVWGATAKETAVVASHILGKTITVPKAFQKSSGAALEAEKQSFAYIFVHNFLPVLRTFMFIAVVAASLFYLVYKFIYIPNKAETLYRMGYERIFDGEYQRANERFSEAFGIHRKKNWFYKYAEAFRDERQYLYAEQKYDELLRYYLRDKKGVLDYAALETYYLRNYAKADSILRNQLLDYAPNDFDGLLAAGDNCLMWGDVEPSKYEEARYYYARLLEKYGWKEPIVERMMKYFIRTDNLKEVLPLKNWFDSSPKRSLSAESMGELGGYLLDKQLEEVRGVPNEYVEYIDGVRDLLLQAVYADQTLPEPHYHLARYYNNLGNAHEERVTLRIAARAFEAAPEGSVRRLNYHIDTLRRYADALINDREFIPAEEQLIKGINLYEDAVSRRLISRTPQYGRLYAGMGDLEYFTKTGDMEAALRYYHRSEQNGWAPPEMQYRMGSAYYQLEDWKNALEYLSAASSSLPQNRRILFAMGNAALKRGDYSIAQGYYGRLLDILESQRSRLPVLLPNDRPEYLELAERLMMARNNAGVASQMLAGQTGNRSYYTRAISFYAEAERAWDSRTRDPRTMIRSGSTPLPYLNSRSILYPQGNYEPQIFIRIDREALETSKWEILAQSY